MFTYMERILTEMSLCVFLHTCKSQQVTLAGKKVFKSLFDVIDTIVCLSNHLNCQLVLHLEGQLNPK